MNPILQNPLLLDLQKKTGIDFSKYQTKALIDNIADVFATIPKFQMMVILPIVAVIIVDIVFLVVKNPHNIASILFFIVLLTVAFIVAGGLGFYFASMKLITEVNEAASLSIETTQLIYQDIHKTTEKATQQELIIPSASEVLKGVVIGLFLPILSNYAIEKAGFLAKGIFWVVEKVLLQIVLLISGFIDDAISKLPLQKADSKIDVLNEKVNENAIKIQAKLKKIEGIIGILDKSKVHINNFSEIGKKLIAVPTLTIIAIYGGISGFFLLVLFFLM
jgi:hypothetical protein